MKIEIEKAAECVMDVTLLTSTVELWHVISSHLTADPVYMGIWILSAAFYVLLMLWIKGSQSSADTALLSKMLWQCSRFSWAMVLVGPALPHESFPTPVLLRMIVLAWTAYSIYKAQKLLRLSRFAGSSWVR